MGNINELKEIHNKELKMLIEMHKICMENDLTYYLAYGTALGAVRHKGFIPWDNDIDIMVHIDGYDEFCNVLNEKMPNKYIVNTIENNKKYEQLFARIHLQDDVDQNICIDIFPIVGAPNTNIKKVLFSKISYLIFKSFYIKKVNISTTYKDNPKKRKQAFVAKLILSPFSDVFFIWVYKKLSTAFPIEKSDTIYNICGSYGYKELIPKSYLEKPAYLEFEGHEFPVPQEWDKYLTHIYGDYMTPKKENYV